VTEPVSPEEWERLKESLQRALELGAAEREEYLANLEKSDPEHAHGLNELLQDFRREALESPPWKPIPEPVDTLAPGWVLQSRYQVEERIGSGGTGEVYRVYDRHRGIQIALKTIRTALMDKQGAVAALRNEVNTAGIVTHPNVCRLYDISIPAPGSGDPAFITMELLSGETLAARLGRGRMSVEEASPLVAQMIEALEAAHGRGILHRDLKPGNVMLVEEDGKKRAVILDFGIAQCRSPSDTLRSVLSGEWCAGTPAYMAPEILDGKKATIASDIHSLGVMMFEMVTGRLPFEGETPMAIAVRRLNRDAPRAGRYVSGLDRRWDYAISRCLERDPKMRPRSASEISLLLHKRAPLTFGKVSFSIAALTALLLVFMAVRPRSVNPNAQADLDNARVALRNQSKEGFGTAIRELKQAIDAEPRWADPWADLAYAYAAGSNARFIDDKLALHEARIDAMEAIRLNPRLAQAYGALGWTQSLDFNEWPKAESSFLKGLELDGTDARVRYWFAVHLRKKGRFREADQQLEKAMELTHRQDANVWSERAFLYWTSGQIGKMREHMAEQLISFPNFPATRYLNARLLKLEGRYGEADKELAFSEALGLNPATVLVERASLSAFRGNAEKARGYLKQIEEMARTGQVDGLLVAGVYAKMADFDRAFVWLEAAYKEADNTLLSLATSPVIAPLRSDRRYSDLLLRLHFTPQIMQQMEFSSSSTSGASSQPSRTGTS